MLISLYALFYYFLSVGTHQNYAICCALSPWFLVSKYDNFLGNESPEIYFIYHMAYTVYNNWEMKHLNLYYFLILIHFH